MENTNNRYEGCGEEGPIRSIFLAEFHHLEGPRIRCQASVDEKNDCLTKEIFDATSNYIIPKPRLASQTVTLNVLGYKVSGYPVILEDKKYKRNIFIFNLCFVYHPWSRTVQYEPAIKKLHEYLINLELENEFVSREENTSEIRTMIEKILRDLNGSTSSSLVSVRSLGEVQQLTLKVNRLVPAPPPVYDHDVPVLIVDWTKYSKNSWDLTTKELLQYIDGFNHVARIANLAEVETRLVKSDVVNLLYHGVAKVIPIFTYSDNYAITPKLRKLRESPTFQLDCLRICSMSPNPIPEFQTIYKFISGFSNGSSVRNLVARFHPRNSGFCERKLIQFLVLNNVLRKIHKYPIFIRDEECALDITKCEDYYKMFNGHRHLDELSVIIGVPSKDLEEQLEDDPHIYVLKK